MRKVGNNLQFSVGVEYTIHCLLHMMDMYGEKSISVKTLSEYQNLSETYLSKMFTKLTKAKIISSVPGVKGGYEFTKEPKDISFWDIIEAIEGKEHFFNCAEIRSQEILLDQDNLPKEFTHYPCLIKQVMWEGENKMKDYLKTKNLQWLYDMTKLKLEPDYFEEKKEWFMNK